MTLELRLRWIVTAALALATIVAALGIGTRVAHSAPERVRVQGQAKPNVLERLFPDASSARSGQARSAAQKDTRKAVKPINRKKVRRHTGRRASMRASQRGRPARAAVQLPSSREAARAVSALPDQVPIDFDARGFAAFASQPMLDATPIVPRLVKTVSVPPRDLTVGRAGGASYHAAPPASEPVLMRRLFGALGGCVLLASLVAFALNFRTMTRRRNEHVLPPAPR